MFFFWFVFSLDKTWIRKLFNKSFDKKHICGSLILFISILHYFSHLQGFSHLLIFSLITVFLA